MKNATFSKSAFGVTAKFLGLAGFVGLVATACANSEDVQTGDVAPTEPAPAATVPPTAKVTPPEKKCATACKVDSECQNSCPAIPGGVQCCDPESGPAGTCFPSKTSACPPPKPKPEDPKPGY